MHCSACKSQLQQSWAYCAFCGRDLPEQAAEQTKCQKFGSYGAGIRGQMFELVVQQALAGLPWKQTCAAAMSANEITSADVEGEIRRRMASGQVSLIQANNQVATTVLKPQAWNPVR